MYAVVEYDGGPCWAWGFETLEEAKEFRAKKYKELDREEYWVSYRIEEVEPGTLAEIW